MTLFFVLVILLFAGLTVVFLEGAIKFGIIFWLPFLGVATGIWLALEVWAHRYISKRGVFTRLDAPKKEDDPT